MEGRNRENSAVEMKRFVGADPAGEGVKKEPTAERNVQNDDARRNYVVLAMPQLCGWNDSVVGWAGCFP